jgi:thioredoxin-related protein
MGKRLSLILALLACVSVVSGQGAIAPKIKWLTFEEAEWEARQAKSPRKFMVELYTDKCGLCKKMDLSTFQNEFIAHYVNENFYPVKFNAELRKDIQFNSQLFKLDKSGYHELAIALTMGDLAFPTLVFLDEDYQIIQPIQGYQTVDELERIMFYFANNMHKTTPWNTFVQHYQPTNSKPRVDPRVGPDHLLIIPVPVPPHAKSKGEVIKKKN